MASPETICLVSRADFLPDSQELQGLEQFGINRVLWPEAQLAADIEGVVTAPGAIDAESFAGGADPAARVRARGRLDVWSRCRSGSCTCRAGR